VGAVSFGDRRRSCYAHVVSSLAGPRRPVLGAVVLVLAAVCWGLGFYAQRVSITELSALWATALRFLVAVPCVVGVLWWRWRRGVVVPWAVGGLLGVLLYVAFALQTVAMQHTPVSRVALLTGLYGVVTPLLQPAFGLGWPSRLQWVAALLAVVGTVLLCGIVGDTAAFSAPANIGDLMTLGMAVVGAVVVLIVARVAHETDPIALNAVQIVAMAVCGVVVAVVVEPEGVARVGAIGAATVWSLLYLALFSTIVAFTLQFIGQQHLSAAPAAIIMLLEVPIGVLSAVLLLGEAMAGLQWLGAAVAVVAVVVAVIGERR
jgi:drug/metabolite transporter (DMT)-like permease